MADLDTLVSDIYSLLEGKLVGDDSVLEKFGPELGKVFAKRFSSSREERVPTLRMSNIGRPLRQLWYELNGYKAEEISGKTLLKFSYGDLTESLVLVLAEASGHEVKDFQDEIEVEGIKGHIDAVIDGVLVDVKSCSPYSFDKFKTGSLLEEGNDPFGYVAQLSGYAHAKKLPAAWVAFNKQSGELCILKLPQEKIDEYNVIGRINQVREVIASKCIPERCYSDEPDGKSGNRKLGISCSYCSYKQSCWDDANGGTGLKVYSYSTGPRFLTTVVREPKVFEFKQESN